VLQGIWLIWLVETQVPRIPEPPQLLPLVEYQYPNPFPEPELTHVVHEVQAEGLLAEHCDMMQLGRAQPMISASNAGAAWQL
jgi:hypothetical protein